jgi:ribosomal-protein-alanine N-acetyltransferase
VSLLVRAAVAADSAVLALIDEAASVSPWPQAQLQAACRAGAVAGVRALAAEDDTGLSGFLVLARVLDEASIHHLAVRPSRQRRGVASALLEAALSQCGEGSVRRLLLEVRASNIGAIALYQRFGFLTDGVRKDYYPLAEGREDALLMSRNLGEWA